MTIWKLAVASLWHFWRTNLALLSGVAIGTAVLSGALLVGDSVRGSLRSLTVEPGATFDFVGTEPEGDGLVPHHRIVK